MRPRDTLRSGAGCLYLVSTPIGNLEDITLRALRILKEADRIVCEDTRETLKLLARHDIRKPLESYHEHNEQKRAPELAAELECGARIALVSDAGTPVVSDPGHRLVALCARRGIAVVPVPGPSALLAALAASGLPAHEFVFVGFLPPRTGARRKALRSLAAERRTLVFFEAPHRILKTLADALDTLGDREAVLAREITKVHEEFLRGRASELLAALQRKPPRGEMTLILAPPEPATAARAGAAAATPEVPLARRIEEILRAENVDRKAALKRAAREQGLSRREAYRQLIESKREPKG